MATISTAYSIENNALIIKHTYGDHCELESRCRDGFPFVRDGFGLSALHALSEKDYRERVVSAHRKEAKSSLKGNLVKIMSAYCADAKQVVNHDMNQWLSNSKDAIMFFEAFKIECPASLKADIEALSFPDDLVFQ